VLFCPVVQFARGVPEFHDRESSSA